MPWKEVSTMSQRYEFIQLASSETANMSELCRRYGISRKTGYKWMRRFYDDGREGLTDLSRRPRSSPCQTPEPMVEAALKMRDQHPAWGGRKVKARLEALGHQNVPSPSTLTAIFHRENRMQHDENKQAKPYIRFEHEAPNDLWQMDFKGDFPIQQARCYPLTILDDHSRFNVCLRACLNQQSTTVQEALTATFRIYGLPYRMTMDNGSPWGSDTDHSYTSLTLWLIRLGIGVSHSRPYHPQTQGKDERFHRTLKAEVLNYTSFRDWHHCETKFDQWRNIYNLERPHEALDMKTPASRYEPSARSFPETLPPIEYGPNDIVRKAYEPGFFSYKGKSYKIGRAFRGHPIALRYTEQDGVLDVYFCQHKVKQISLDMIH